MSRWHTVARGRSRCGPASACRGCKGRSPSGMILSSAGLSLCGMGAAGQSFQEGPAALVCLLYLVYTRKQVLSTISVLTEPVFLCILRVGGDGMRKSRGRPPKSEEERYLF